MSALAANNPTPEVPPVIDLERRHADRAQLAQRLVELNASSARLRETAQAEAAVLQEVGSLTRDDAAAMLLWATGGCVGDVPVPDQKQRRTLAEKLATAQAAAAAAVGAGQDIDHQIGQLNRQLAIANEAIEQAALEVITLESAAILEQHSALIRAQSETIAKVIGLRLFFTDEGRNLTDRGDLPRGRKYFERSAELGAAMTLLENEEGATKAAIDAAGHAWSSRLATLRSGS